MPAVRLLGDDVVVAAHADETILQALYRSGYGYRIGCTRGGCGICKVDLVDGAVEYTARIAATVLSPEEIATGTCLSCRAIPLSDIVIRLRDQNLRRLNPYLAGIRGKHEPKGQSAWQ